jgi:RNA polymerase sigma-70 factor (ECF subfamily)
MIEDAVKRARAGDRSAWKEIFGRHHRGVRRVCSSFDALSDADVEDMVQETFIRAFESLAQLREDGAIGPWLLTIARSRCLSRLARRGSEHRAATAFARDPAAGAGALAWEGRHVEREARIALVRKLIADLPAGPERETAELFYVDGTLSAQKIAERLGTGKSTVTMRLERFRAKVKRRLLANLMQLGLEEA